MQWNSSSPKLPEEPCAVLIVGVPVAHVLEARGFPAGEHHQAPREHLKKMTRLSALGYANLRGRSKTLSALSQNNKAMLDKELHLHGFSTQLVVHLHGLDCRRGFFVLTTLVSLPEVDDVTRSALLLVRVLDHVGVTSEEEAVCALIHGNLQLYYRVEQRNLQSIRMLENHRSEFQLTLVIPVWW